MPDVIKLQETIIAKMGFEDQVEPELPGDISLLTRILECDSESIELALGKFGEKLKAFSHAVDLKHPHIKELFEEMFDGEFYQDVVELLELAEFAIKKNLTRVLPSIGKAITREKLSNSVLKSIDSPFNNRWRIRLLHTREERDLVRKEKKMQAIDLTTVVKKGEDLWASQPENFDSFIRGGIAYEEEISFANKKAQRYLKMGCSGMAKQILDSIEQFKSQVQEIYYGFNRITMTNAAVILAKMLGYKLATYWVSEKKQFRIIASRDVFADYQFDKSDREIYDYEPRVYPYHKLEHMASDRVKKIIDHLEYFPKACNKSIFDSYAVIVPGIMYPNPDAPFSPDAPFRVFDRKGDCVDFLYREDAVQMLDANFIERGYITPILLGEKDGRCFFISFFA